MSWKENGRSVLAASLALLLSGTMTAAGGGGLDERITLDLKDAQLQKVFEIYREILDIELDIDPSIDEAISVAFEDITVRTSLNVICESAGCRWNLLEGDPGLLQVTRDDAREGQDGQRLVVKESRGNVFATHGSTGARHHLDSPVSIDLVEADATAVLELAAKILGAKLLLDRKLEGKLLTVHVSAVPLSNFLDTICADLGCDWKLLDGDSPTLEVYFP